MPRGSSNPSNLPSCRVLKLTSVCDTQSAVCALVCTTPTTMRHTLRKSSQQQRPERERERESDISHCSHALLSVRNENVLVVCRCRRRTWKVPFVGRRRRRRRRWRGQAPLPVYAMLAKQQQELSLSHRAALALLNRFMSVVASTLVFLVVFVYVASARREVVTTTTATTANRRFFWLARAFCRVRADRFQFKAFWSRSERMIV